MELHFVNGFIHCRVAVQQETTIRTSFMQKAGLQTEAIEYTLNILVCLQQLPNLVTNRRDFRWSLSLSLTDGSQLSLPTTGFWPYSSGSIPAGVTAYTMSVRMTWTLTLDRILKSLGGSSILFDNPSPIWSYVYLVIISLGAYMCSEWAHIRFHELALHRAKCHSRSTCIHFASFIADYCISHLSQLGNLKKARF